MNTAFFLLGQIMKLSSLQNFPFFCNCLPLHTWRLYFSASIRKVSGKWEKKKKETLKKEEEIYELIKAYARQKEMESVTSSSPWWWAMQPQWSITLDPKPSSEETQNQGVTDKAVRNSSPQEEQVPHKWNDQLSRQFIAWARPQQVDSPRQKEIQAEECTLHLPLESSLAMIYIIT